MGPGLVTFPSFFLASTAMQLHTRKGALVDPVPTPVGIGAIGDSFLEDYRSEKFSAALGFGR